MDASAFLTLVIETFLTINRVVSALGSPNNGAAKIYRSSCRRDGLFKLTDRGKVLSGVATNIIASSHAKSLPICARSCVRAPNCQSFNYKKKPSSETDKNCQLLDIVKSNSAATLTSAVGWHHYEPITQASPRCRNIAVECDPGYACIDNCLSGKGYECNEVDECESNPCQNGATCDNLINKYQCTCAPGWEGTNCQINIQECASSPCQNGGTCTDDNNKYTCACAAGYTGLRCETNINECASSPCQNGGTCTDDINKYTCACAAGYTGLRCETNINECASSPCQNGGTCTDGINKYNCSCATGYTGLRCEININECASSPCHNGGTCTDGINKYNCSCATGTTGLRCEINFNECASSPCQNGGSCIDGISKYTCACTAGYAGVRCETNINECASSPCQNGGTCTDGINKYNCTCAAGYTGLRCETNINECFSSPCKNGTICTDGVNNYTCACRAGYAGQQCETNINECASNPCQNAGTCTDGINNYKCNCVPEYVGLSCEKKNELMSCKQLKHKHGYLSNGVYKILDKAKTHNYTVYCNMEYGGWTLIARFSNKDAINWIARNGSYWYDTTEAGSTTSTTSNADMVSKAFHNAPGGAFKITRTDAADHRDLLYTTSDCLGGKDFRTFITSFGNFRNGASWVNRDSCKASCQVHAYSNEYATTEGFAQAGCSGTVQAWNRVGFWCHYGSGDGAVIMIGGGGSVCSRADHGLAITEADTPKLSLSPFARDFGNDGLGTATSAYALNLWVR